MKHAVVEEHMVNHMKRKSLIRTLDRFKCCWLATTADIWNGLPTDLILQEEASVWCTILKDVQCCIYALDFYHM